MSNSTIEEIKQRLNIIDVISSYIPLKKAGTNYKANCPFHQEKTASLMISPSKQIWHCFGCGEGGDLFGFVMKYENMDFGEALKVLAERAGVQLPKYGREDKKEDLAKKRLLQINDLAAKFYAKVFETSSVAAEARKYMKNRGLPLAIIREWQIGFAPNEFHVLEKFLLKKGFKPKELVDAGVSSVSTKNKNEIYDRFFARVTFPIKNYAGDVVAFTARTLDPFAKTAKYINSPETAIYNKGKIIFGLYQAKQAIRHEDCAVIVEGNMDVIACHQAGFKNAVGSSGTAFTYEQLQMLSRLTKNLKFAFDADAAGATATRRALDAALQLGFNVYIVTIKGAKDPDELIKKDPALWQSAVAEAPLYLDYFFDKAFANYNPNSIQNKKQIITELLPLVQKLHDPVELEHYVHILAQRLGVPEKTVYEVLARSKPQQVSPQQQRNGPPQKPLLRTRESMLEEKLLGYALFNAEFRSHIAEKANLPEFKEPKVHAILERIVQAQLTDIDAFIASLGDLSEMAKLALFVIESEYSTLGNDQAFKREFESTFKEFKVNSIKVAMSELQREMVLAEQSQNKIQLSTLNQQFSQLSKALNDYKV